MEFNSIKIYDKLHINTYIKQEIYYNNEEIKVN